MSPRVAYWTSSFEPSIEAVASEVESLRRAFPGSAAWGVSARDTRLIRLKSGLAFHPRAALAFRAVTGLLQWVYDVNHVFGSRADWHHLRAVLKRPAILTLCLEGQGSVEWLQRFDHFAVEWTGAADELLACGIKRDQISVILPAVDLGRFQMASKPSDPFTVLFSSSPDRADWLDSRGVPLLLEAAALCPEMCFRLIWRPWGDSLQAVQRMVRKYDLHNVNIVCDRVRDMALHVQAAHVVVAPFLDMHRCKPTPNSIIEGLACGRPAVVSRRVGIADLVVRQRAGFVCLDDAGNLAACLQEARRHWESLSMNARKLAEDKFGLARFVAAYRSLYSRVSELN